MQHCCHCCFHDEKMWDCKSPLVSLYVSTWAFCSTIECLHCMKETVEMKPLLTDYQVLLDLTEMAQNSFTIWPGTRIHWTLKCLFLQHRLSPAEVEAFWSWTSFDWILIIKILLQQLHLMMRRRPGGCVWQRSSKHRRWLLQPREWWSHSTFRPL